MQMELSSGRSNVIDLLRGFSILSVILLHCYIHMPLSSSFLPQPLINILFRSGYYGVMIFFVISGFLITTTSLKRWGDLNNIPIKNFYQMRFARIMPSLIALLFILSILHLLSVQGFTIHTTSLKQAIISALTFQINWLEAKTGYLPANWDILWSLSVEEMFYLFFPLMCLFFKKPFHFILAISIFILLGPFSRTIFTDNEMWSDHSYFSCMDGIAIGCMAAMFSHYIKANKAALISLLVSGLLLFTFIFFFRKQVSFLGFTKIGFNVTLLEISIGLILIGTKNWYLNTNQQLSWASPIVWFGRNSYEIYLTHSFFVISFSKILFNDNQSNLLKLCWYISVIILAGIVGQLTSSYFSAPMNNLLRNKKMITPLIQRKRLVRENMLETED